MEGCDALSRALSPCKQTLGLLVLIRKKRGLKTELEEDGEVEKEAPRSTGCQGEVQERRGGVPGSPEGPHHLGWGQPEPEPPAARLPAAPS